MNEPMIAEKFQTEEELLEAIIGVATMCGWLHYHTRDSRRSAKGFPDLVLIRPPRVLFIECKSQQGRLAPVQRHWGILLEACPGVEYALIRPSGWNVVEALLR